MLIRLKSYLLTSRIFIHAAKIYFHLRKYLRNDYLKSLDFPDELKNDYFYHSKYYNRAKQYMHANHFFGELLCITRGKKMQLQEMHRFAYLSSCAPIFDDFFEKNQDNEELKQLMYQPQLINAKTPSEKTAAFFFSKILNEHNDRQQLLAAADHLFNAQLESKSQLNKSLAIEELLKISIDKGGYSGLMYALLLENKKSEQFLNLAFQLGSYGQLMDDVFDLYDDAKSGIRTFANQALSVKEIRMQIEKQEEQLIGTISNLNLIESRHKRFLQVLSVFKSVIEIGLQQYENIEKYKNISPVQCLKLERNEWIVDMEKVSNIWKLYRLSAQEIR